MASLTIGAWGAEATQLLAGSVHGRDGLLDGGGSLRLRGVAGATVEPWRCWLSGRLTNAKELCARYGLRGNASAQTALARALREEDLEACALLRGTFVAIALNRDRCVVWRDQLGGRPLLYMRIGGATLFAEHEREILALLRRTPAPDRLALARWIDRGRLPPQQTLFEGIMRVPPAHRLVLEQGTMRMERYWQPRYAGIAQGSRAALAERLGESAFASVGRTVSDAKKPGVSLSGGIDSACVAAGLAARAAPAAPAIALGGVFPNHPETDERRLMEATAQHTGLALEEIPFEEGASMLAPALRYLGRWRVPPMSPNLFVWRPMKARAAALRVDVLLDGEGGDELFGLSTALIADMLRAGYPLAAWTLAGLTPAVGASPGVRMQLRALRFYGVSGIMPEALRQFRARRRPPAPSSPSSLLLDADAEAMEGLREDLLMEHLDGPLWWRALATQMAQWGEAMGAAGQFRRDAIDDGIDRRHPFLHDIELLETVLSTPPELQFDALRDRPLLRDALRGHVPEAVRTRHEKSDFMPVIRSGLDEDGAVLAARLGERDAPIREYVRGDALDRILAQRAGGGSVRTARQLWQAGLADAWLRASERPVYLVELDHALQHRDNGARRAAERRVGG
jgi:asparagine synthase (glutamine-hydrolysing)